MRILKAILSNIHRYILWALISVFLWAWIFLFVTDAPADKKVTIYYNAPGAEDELLAIELEKTLPEGIKMIKVYPFSHAAFDTDAPEEADIYIVSETDIDAIADRLQPLEKGSDTDFVKDGICYGLRIYSKDTGIGAAKSFIRYEGRKDIPDGAVPLGQDETQGPVSVEFRADENYYLCFNRNSIHLGELNGSKDSAALEIAERLETLP